MIPGIQDGRLYNIIQFSYTVGVGRYDKKIMILEGISTIHDMNRFF